MPQAAQSIAGYSTAPTGRRYSQNVKEKISANTANSRNPPAFPFKYRRNSFMPSPHQIAHAKLGGYEIRKPCSVQLFAQAPHVDGQRVLIHESIRLPHASISFSRLTTVPVFSIAPRCSRTGADAA